MAHAVVYGARYENGRASRDKGCQKRILDQILTSFIVPDPLEEMLHASRHLVRVGRTEMRSNHATPFKRGFEIPSVRGRESSTSRDDGRRANNQRPGWTEAQIIAGRRPGEHRPAEELLRK